MGHVRSGRVGILWCAVYLGVCAGIILGTVASSADVVTATSDSQKGISLQEDEEFILEDYHQFMAMNNEIKKYDIESNSYKKVFKVWGALAMGITLGVSDNPQEVRELAYVFRHGYFIELYPLTEGSAYRIELPETITVKFITTELRDNTWVDVLATDDVSYVFPIISYFGDYKTRLKVNILTIEAMERSLSDEDIRIYIEDLDLGKDVLGIDLFESIQAARDEFGKPGDTHPDSEDIAKIKKVSWITYPAQYTLTHAHSAPSSVSLGYDEITNAEYMYLTYAGDQNLYVYEASSPRFIEKTRIFFKNTKNIVVGSLIGAKIGVDTMVHAVVEKGMTNAVEICSWVITHKAETISIALIVSGVVLTYFGFPYGLKIIVVGVSGLLLSSLLRNKFEELDVMPSLEDYDVLPFLEGYTFPTFANIIAMILMVLSPFAIALYVTEKVPAALLAGGAGLVMAYSVKIIPGEIYGLILIILAIPLAYTIVKMYRGHGA